MRRLAPFVIIAMTIAVGLADQAGLLAPLSRGLADLGFRAAHRHVSGSVVVVDIDTDSIQRLGVWPWPRRIHAEAIDRLMALGATDVAIDIDLSSPSTEAGDAALEAALARANGAVTLAAFNDRSTPGGRLVSPLPRFADKAWTACVDVAPDPDGRIRRLARAQPGTDGPCTAMAVMIAGGIAEAGRPFRIDYSIDPATFDHVSIADLIGGKVARQRIENRHVILGATAVELRDYFLVPLHGMVAGPVVQALGAETLIQRRALADAPPWGVPAGLGLLALIALVAGPRAGLKAGLLALGLAAALIEATALLLQQGGGVVVDTAAWQIALAGLALLLIGREIGLGRMLLALSRAETRRVWSMLDRVIEENFTGIVVADENGLVRVASREAAELLGLDRDTDLTGRFLPLILPPALRSAVASDVAAYRASGAAARTPVEIDCATEKGPPRILEYTVTLSEIDGTKDSAEGDKPLALCLMVRDVTDRKLEQDRIERLARSDALTGIPNRNRFFELLEAGLAAKTGTAGVACFDLDQFKAVNDGFGHNVGDDLLRAVADRAAEVVGEDGVLARLGGDEFAIMLEGGEAAVSQRLTQLAHRLQAAMAAPFRLGPYEIVASVSVGLAECEDGESADQLMRKADVALYEAKSDGGGVRAYDAALGAALARRADLQEELKLALKRGELAVVYQPQVELSTRRLTGVEALVRWSHPVLGPVSPAEFIPIAEQCGLMPAIGGHVLEEACREVARWPGTVKVAVNVSSRQFERTDLVAVVQETLARTGLAPQRLALEITESLFIQDGGAVSETLRTLRGLGIEIALDDFGTGYSSLGYIRRFPIDKIKIDQSFVRGLPLDVEAMAIIRAIVSMGDSLSLGLIAEGIETEEQAEMLRLAGCRHGQGYRFGRPATAEAIRAQFFEAEAELARVG
jgi:diguanylate cyclase (GGDEF)-like protein/PAS domain S-box-containing protein